MSGCPSSQRLQDWLADRLAGPDADAVGSHVEACADCQQTLEQLTGDGNRCRQVTVDAAGPDFLRRLEKEPPPCASASAGEKKPQLRTAKVGPGEGRTCQDRSGCVWRG
jgi:hypothetical protein